MKKQLSILSAAVLSLSLSASAQALTTGDIAFTSFNADEDGLAFVTFTDIAANTSIYFADNEWDGSAFNTGESYSMWNSGASTIAAGTVIRLIAYDIATPSASLGSLARVSVASNTNWGISNSGETIYAYQGASATTPTSFLAAITNGTFTANGSLTNTGLTDGVNAITLPSSSDYYEYNGLRSGEPTFTAYKDDVANIANWTGHNGSGNPDFSATIPNITAFTVTAVPEPETYALLLAGLGLVSFMARRRKV